MSKVVHFEETNTFEVSMLVLLNKQVRFFHWFVTVDHSNAVVLRLPKRGWEEGLEEVTPVFFPPERMRERALVIIISSLNQRNHVSGQFHKVYKSCPICESLLLFYNSSIKYARGGWKHTRDVLDFIMCFSSRVAHFKTTKEIHLSRCMIHLLLWSHPFQVGHSWSCPCSVLRVSPI